MNRSGSILAVVLVCAFSVGSAWADRYAETIQVFQNAGESGAFFDRAYGYAVFPTIGKAGLVLGGAGGKGRVYVGGQHIGNTTMGQVTLGLLAGGQAFSMIVFFEDERAFREFTSGTFEFSAEANAVAVTAGAAAKASTAGSSAGASGTRTNANTVGQYYRGMATFTVVRGGLMFEAALGGAAFTYEPL